MELDRRDRIINETHTDQEVLPTLMTTDKNISGVNLTTVITRFSTPTGLISVGGVRILLIITNILSDQISIVICNMYSEQI